MTNLYYTSPSDVAALTKVRSLDLNTVDAAVDAAFDKLPTETNIKQGKVNYAVTGGSANVYTISLPHAPASYTDGLLVEAYIHANNTGASTINVNSLGNKSIKLQNGDNPAAGDLQKFVTLRYSTTTGFFHAQANSVISASAASTSATAAAASASSAASSASSAASSSSAAAISAAAAAASYDAFDDRYLGSKSSNPTLDNDGNALLTGALYWNSVATEMMVYNGSTWESVFNDAVGLRPEQYGAVGNGVTSDASAIEALLTAAWNGGSNCRKVIWGSKTYLIDRKISVTGGITEWEGQGNILGNAGTVLKWTGADAQMIEFSTYATGAHVKNICFDTTSVSTAVQVLKFATGLSGFIFSNCKWKGYHTGSSWGGTYADHDAVYVVGGSGVTKYDFSDGMFEQCQFIRMRDGVTQSGDPASGGPGNSIKFDTCFSWCKRNTIKLFGANNGLYNCEFNTESAQHTVVQSGQYAVGWIYLNCDWGTATSGDGNQPIYADTSGSANFASVEGGTIQESNGGGFNDLIKDAGVSGGAIQRWKSHGVINFDSRVLKVEQVRLAAAQGIGSNNFYEEGTFTPNFGATLTVVTGGGSVSYSGKYTCIGNIVYWSAVVDAAGGATTESTFGVTFITNLPYNVAGVDSICTAINAGSGANYGYGQIVAGGNNAFTPTWSATSSDVIISGWYFTDRTT